MGQPAPVRNAATVLLLTLASTPAGAIDYDFGEDINLTWHNRVSVGGAWRPGRAAY